MLHGVCTNCEAVHAEQLLHCVSWLASQGPLWNVSPARQVLHVVHTVLVSLVHGLEINSPGWQTSHPAHTVSAKVEQFATRRRPNGHVEQFAHSRSDVTVWLKLIYVLPVQLRRNEQTGSARAVAA